MAVHTRATRVRRPARTAPPAAALLLLAVATGCTGSGSVPTPATQSATTPTTTSPTPSADAATLPLTGRPGSARRPAVVVKVENSAAARPQRGLGSADIVVEQLVEGGGTRFAAFFQSTDPGTVGPVRSVRNVDAAIAGPTRGVLAFSGGAKVALRVVAKADLQLVTPGDVRGAFTRSSARSAPHNLFLDVSAVWDAMSATHAAAPAPYLPFGPLDPATVSSAATSATVRFSPSARPVWTYDADGERWARSERAGAPAVGDDGSRLVADAVLVLRVRVRDAGYRDPAGNPVPESVFTGSGEATLLTGGRAVPGRWSKTAAGAALVLTTGAGDPLTVPPGRTWVELLPAAGSLTLA
jgi:hypothetical protein